MQILYLDFNYPRERNVLACLDVGCLVRHNADEELYSGLELALVSKALKTEIVQSL
jgi:hypothetical protein